MKKTLKKVGKILLAVVAVILIVAVVYVGYVWFEYDRIEDDLPLEVLHSDRATDSVKTGEEYTAITYNIGFGAYSPDYSFFLDTGTMNGKKVSGKNGKGESQEEVIKNTEGAISVITGESPDFVLLQEVDEDGNRSYHVNQKNSLLLSGYAGVYAVNYHSAYLFYPFHDPIGKSDSGILTLSRYKIDSSLRRALPLATDLSKFFDLDRCISITRLPVEGSDKQLVIINVHLSAYDEGGVIRAKQTQMLNGILAAETGNYVIVGGDFNQLLSDKSFPTTISEKDHTAPFPKEDLPEGYTVKAGDDATCRNANMPYVKGESYLTIIDGFIVSQNVKVKSVKNVLTEFEYSDHNPVKLTFSLN